MPPRPPTPPCVRFRTRRFRLPTAYTPQSSPNDIGLRVYWPSRPPLRRLVCDSCSSGQEFSCRFLQTPPRGGRPCVSAGSSCHQGLHRHSHPASQFPVRFRSPVDSVRHDAIASCLTQHKKSHLTFECKVANCGADRDRTGNLLDANQALSQLSYGPKTARFQYTDRPRG